MKHPVLALLLIFLMATPLYAGAGKKEAIEAARELPEIRMGYLQSDLHQLAAFVALKKGFFEAEGLNVKVAGIFKAGPEEMSAFAAGSLDAGYVGEAPATTAVANNAADVTVVAQVNLEGSAIVVRKDASIKSVKELEGKTIAVPGHSTVQDFLLRKALSRSGIEGRAKVIVVKPPEMITALDRGDIDAFIAWEPYPAKAVSMGVGRILIYSGDIWPGHPCCAVVVDNNLLKNHREVVRKLLCAHIKATDYIKSHQEEAVRLGVEFTGLDETSVRLALRSIKFEVLPSIDGEMEYVRFLNKLGYIKVDDPEAFTGKFIDDSLIKEILQEK
jgi:NitT/TauT family transport system substrate-binding protein